jgi:bacteriocin-like protein
MNTFNLTELSTKEMQEIDGGLQIIVCGILVYDTACPKGERWWGC